MNAKSIITLLCICISVCAYSQQAVTAEVLFNNPLTSTKIVPEAKVYPNPVVDLFRIDLRDYIGSYALIQIYNDKNQRIYSYKIEKVDSHYIQLSAYALGMIKGDFTLEVECPLGNSRKELSIH